MKKVLIAIITFIFLFFAVKAGRLSAYTPAGNYLVLNGGYMKTNISNFPPSAFDFDAWIYTGNVNGISHILSVGNKNTGQLNYEVDINGGSLSFRYRYGNGSQVLMAAGEISPNAWNHIEVAVSSVNAFLSINGQKVMTRSGATQLAPIGDTIVLGDSFQESFFSENSFKGLIDEVIINDAEISAATVPPPPPMLLWHLDEARGQTIAVDSSGNHLDGQLIGGDNSVHFFGVLPTPTPFVFPTWGFSFVLPTLPQLRSPFPTQRVTPVNPTASPTGSIPAPTPITDTSLRTNRPIAPR